MNNKIYSSSIVFKGYEYMDGAYTSMLVASDGGVYMGLCTHNGENNAVLVKYNPATGKCKSIADMGEATGERNLGRYPQGKIHSKIRQLTDGKIYFATHFSFPMGVVNASFDYPGGHFMVYDPDQGICKSIGKGPEHEGIIAAEMDSANLVIYGLTYPSGYFLLCNIKEGTIKNFGSLSQGNPCRTIGVDSTGSAYFSRETGEIIMYNASTEQIHELPAKVPHLRGITTGPWRTILWDDTENIFYGIDGRTSLLFTFDPLKECIRGIGLMCAECEIGDELSTFPSLAFCQAQDRSLFYISPRGIFDYFDSKPLNGPAHLITYNPRTNKINDHGEIWSDENRRLFGTQNAALSLDEKTLYLLGAVEAFPSDKTVPFTTIPTRVNNVIKRIPYQLRLLIIDLDQIQAR